MRLQYLGGLQSLPKRWDFATAIADQFNRYNRLRIVVGDRELAATELSGAFDADDPESLIDALETMGGVCAYRSNPNVIRLRAL